MSRLSEIYKEESQFKSYLASLALVGLGYGMYKGVFDNYLAQIVQMGEFERGIAEFFRELPGFLLVGVLALLYRLSGETIFKFSLLGMLFGLVMMSVIPPTIGMVIFTICFFSMAEHIQLGMRNTLGIQYAKPGKGGESMGKQTSLYELGTVIGLLVITVLFRIVPQNTNTFRTVFLLSAGILLISALCSLKMKSKSTTDSSKRRFYFNRKYKKYYLLEITYGARKQVFFTFGPYLLVLHYGADASTMSLLLAISAISCFVMSPIVGRIIDKLGYKTVMVSDTLILVIVCFFYGFSEFLFSTRTSFFVCCGMYILDSIISLASMASNVYVQDLSDSPEETRATITTGMSVNHLITILVALFGGWIWKKLGIQTLFTLSAVIGLANSAYAATIKTSQKNSDKD